MADKNKARDPQESLEDSIAKAVRAIAKNEKIEVLFGHTPRISGDIVFLNKPQNSTNKKRLAETRGEADGQAFRFIFHNEKLHNQLAPDETTAKELFDSAEQGRVEACGAATMAGCKKNIVAAWQKRVANLLPPETPHTPVPPAVLGAVVWEKLHGTQFNSKVMDLWRKQLEKQGGALLNEIEAAKNNQKDFAQKIQNLLEQLGLSQPPLEPPEPSEDENPSEEENEQEDSDTTSEAQEPDLGESDEEGEEEQEAQSTQEENAEGEEEEGQDSVFVPPETTNAQRIAQYKIFTPHFDEIITAESLSSPEELQQLRQALDKQLSHLHGLVARLSSRLQRYLMARHTYDWEYNLDEGWLDPMRLSRVVISPLHPLTYKQTREKELRDTVVTLLLDNSGSMRGRPITVAALCADIFARTLERCGVKVEILGFTTKHWKGGSSREEWLKADRPPAPGRLNDIRHIIYKSADTPWRRARRNLGLMMREGLLKENIDGEALLWAHQRLLARKEERKILMVISDGAPVDDATLSANSANYLEKNLRAVIGEIESFSPVELLAIGIGHDVTRYYKRAVTILDAEELGEAMISEFVELFDSRAFASKRTSGMAKARRRFDALATSSPTAKKADRAEAKTTPSPA